MSLPRNRYAPTGRYSRAIALEQRPPPVSVNCPAAWLSVSRKASSQVALLSLARLVVAVPPSVIGSRVKARVRDRCCRFPVQHRQRSQTRAFDFPSRRFTGVDRCRNPAVCNRPFPPLACWQYTDERTTVPIPHTITERPQHGHVVCKSSFDTTLRSELVHAAAQNNSAEIIAGQGREHGGPADQSFLSW